MRDGRIVEDRREGGNALVVGRGGWVRLPPELLAQAAISDRAHVRHVSEGLIVTPADGGTTPTTAAEVPRGAAALPDERHGWRPVSAEVRAVTHVYGRGEVVRRVLERLTVAVPAGRLTVVTGRSGSGKTTLLRLLGGLATPEAGTVALDGVPLAQCSDEQRAALRRGRIGYLPQEPAPIGFLSAEENVILTLRMRGWDAPIAARRAAVVLARVGLTDRARQRVSRLSAGEAQRVALARALAGARGLLIVDEPTSRLDEASAAEVAQLLSDAAMNDGQTVVCATHDELVIDRAHEVLSIERQPPYSNPSSARTR